ncbi:hypothetical protein FS837_012848 [Tulasnella sp. UAMH 9824]|nr:hypothetical protein FS837_012848 [Tulasnella sp. UAMH 9824]
MLRNFKSQAITAALAGLVVGLPAQSPSTGPTTTSLGPTHTSTSKPSVTTWCAQIRLGPVITAITPGTAVTGLQLSNPGRSGKATLSSIGYDTAISYTNGGLGFFDNCHEWWLNIGTSANQWKPLSFGFDTEQSFNWVVSMGNILMASGTPSYQATTWFIACQEAGSWVLYLQTGWEEPAGETCVWTQLQIGAGGSSATTFATTTTTSSKSTAKTTTTV